MKKIVKTLFGLIMVIIILSITNVYAIRADEDGENVYAPIVVVSSYEVSDDILIPGENFILTVELENTDKNVSANNILLNLSFSDGISTIYPTLTQEYIESIEPGTKKKVQFEMVIAPYFNRPMAAFGINIAMDNRTNYVTLYAPVEMDNSLFKVYSKTIPEEAVAGEKVSLSLSFRSLLEEKLSDVNLQVFVDDGDKAIATTNIGNISVGASKTENVAFFINETGEHLIKLVLSYCTSEGEEAETELYSGKITITDATSEKTAEVAVPVETSMSDRDKMIIVGCLGLSVVLFVGIIVMIKKYN